MNTGLTNLPSAFWGVNQSQVSKFWRPGEVVKTCRRVQHKAFRSHDSLKLREFVSFRFQKKKKKLPHFSPMGQGGVLISSFKSGCVEVGRGAESVSPPPSPPLSGSTASWIYLFVPPLSLATYLDNGLFPSALCVCGGGGGDCRDFVPPSLYEKQFYSCIFSMFGNIFF